MSALRLARGFTGRNHILKFEGCYHGHSDALLVKAGSGALTFGVPTSPGVPAAFAALTLKLAPTGQPFAFLAMPVLALTTLVIAALCLWTVRGLQRGTLLVAEP